MILFCEECGARNDIDKNQIEGSSYSFSCHACRETLQVSLVDKIKSKTVQADFGLETTVSDALAESEPLNVLVVDDSKMIRRVLCDIINSDNRKKVVGEAANGKEALELLRELNPDVITLDINMPVMDGLTTLKHIMINNPTPTVMISALTQEGASETFDALKYGAIDFLPKPSQVKGGDLQSQQNEILRKIELATGVQIESVRYLRRPSKEKNSRNVEAADKCQSLLALGASEGGYGALLNVIPRLRMDLSSAYVAVMHQAPHHLDSFARYLDQCSELNVDRAIDNTLVKSGTCYLAASTEFVTLEKLGDKLVLQVDASPFPTRHGAINRLMCSASQVLREKAAGVILTGTGDDGLDGLGEIIDRGGTAFIQDPRSCLFKETPVAAAKRYDVEYLVSDKQMAGAINAYIISLMR
ncbi:MAG: chemotaxis protein CheB [Desulfobacteraceae bacterium]|jgi:two-component system chemotaxis response regulator CheB